MSGRLFIRNRQRSHPVNVTRLRRLTRTLLQENLRLKEFDLSICIVRAPEMARLNETFLRHLGSTDVLTFDYADTVGQASSLSPSLAKAGRESPRASATLHGEIFIGLDDIIANARRFRVTWRSELLRCVVHGVLHLIGYDDSTAPKRRKMKREENRLLRKLVG